MIRELRYLLLNPRYFTLFFLGKPEKVFKALAGEPECRFFELKEELRCDPSFEKELRERTVRFSGGDFKLDTDHYFLYALVRLIRPSLIVETGVFDGYFTACFLKGLHDNYGKNGLDGKLISIDLPAYECVPESTSERKRTCLPAGCEPGWVIPQNLEDRWRLHVGDSRDLLPKVLGSEGNLSLFFHDSLHTYSHMTFEFETAWPALDNGGYLMSHDVHWNLSFRDFAKRHRRKEYVAHGFGLIKKVQ